METFSFLMFISSIVILTLLTSFLKNASHLSTNYKCFFGQYYKFTAYAGLFSMLPLMLKLQMGSYEYKGQSNWFGSS